MNHRNNCGYFYLLKKQKKPACAVIEYAGIGRTREGYRARHGTGNKFVYFFYKI